MHVVKVIKLHICARQEEVGNEAKPIMVNDKPRVVLTDLGSTALVSLCGPVI